MSVAKRMKLSGVLKAIADASKASPEFLREAKAPQIIAERLAFFSVPVGGSYLGYRKLKNRKNRKSDAEGMPAPMLNPQSNSLS